MTRKATPSDFDFFYEMYMHPDINPHLLYELMGKADFQPIFEDLLEKTLLYVFEEENQSVGMFKLIPLKYRTAHNVYLGGLAIHPNFGGKGYGLQMMLEIIELCTQLGFLRIELSVGARNEKAMNLYLKAGLEKEGVLRKFTHLKSAGIFLDEVLMSYLVS